MNLVILGAPGAGKGTQAHFVSLHYGIPHISTGDLLRAHMQKGTDIGKRITELMEAGKLVPDEIATQVLTDRLREDDCKNGFLLDGYPRTLKQAKITEETVGAIDKVVSVQVDDSIIIERMSGRRMCSTCGATYHMVYKKPKAEGICDKCGGELIQRDDDKAKTVKERLRIFHEQDEPIKEFFNSIGKLLVVNGEDEIEKIAESIIKGIDNR